MYTPINHVLVLLPLTAVRLFTAIFPPSITLHYYYSTSVNVSQISAKPLQAIFLSNEKVCQAILQVWCIVVKFEFYRYAADLETVWIP